MRISTAAPVVLTLSLSKGADVAHSQISLERVRLDVLEAIFASGLGLLKDGASPRRVAAAEGGP
jgi:hypothetical protein